MHWEFIAMFSLAWGFVRSFRSLLKLTCALTRSIHGWYEYRHDPASPITSQNLAKNISKTSLWGMVNTEVDGVGKITTGWHLRLRPFYIAFIDKKNGSFRQETTFIVDLYCTEKTYQWLRSLTETENKEDIAYNEAIKIGHRIKIVECLSETIQPTKTQQKYVKEVVDYYHHPKAKDVKDRNVCIVYIHGPPGTGKTAMGRLLAQELNAFYARINPGVSSSMKTTEVYYIHKPPEKSLVLALEDYDKILVQLMHRMQKSIETGKEDKPALNCEVHDLASHNSMMDYFHRMNKIIVIITANKSPEDVMKSFKDLDTGTGCDSGSLFRVGRVDLVLRFTKEDLIY